MGVLAGNNNIEETIALKMGKVNAVGCCFEPFTQQLKHGLLQFAFEGAAFFESQRPIVVLVPSLVSLSPPACVWPLFVGFTSLKCIHSPAP